MLDKKTAVEGVKMFVLDMDGTFYLGDRLIEGSLDFLEKVKETGRRFVFFTNNSSRIPSFYQKKLEKMNATLPNHKHIQKLIVRETPFEKTATSKIKRYKTGN